MARKEGDFLKGILGNLVFRVSRGKQIVSQRVVPGTIKHTKATIRAARTFGLASSMGSQVTQAFKEVLKGFHDNEVNIRLNPILAKILNQAADPETSKYSFDQDSFSIMKGFDFNLNSRVGSSMIKLPEAVLVGKKLQVTIPEMSIPLQFKFPFNCSKSILKVSLSIFRFKSGQRSQTLESQSQVLFKNKNSFEGHVFEFDVPNGCLCIVSFALEYFMANNAEWLLTNNKQFSPACICSAIVTPGNYRKEKNRSWVQMRKLYNKPDFFLQYRKPYYSFNTAFLFLFGQSYRTSIDINGLRWA